MNSIIKTRLNSLTFYKLTRNFSAHLSELSAANPGSLR